MEQGLYIVSNSYYEKNNVLKFGYTSNFNDRLNNYKTVIKNSYYLKVYIIDKTKKEIKFIEQEILKKTIDFKTDDNYGLECRKITFEKMNGIINLYMDEHNINYVDRTAKYNISSDNLRSYQRIYIEAARDELNKHSCVYIKAPTGSGKTKMAIEILRDYSNIIIFTPRINLNSQFIKNIPKKYNIIDFKHNNKNKFLEKNIILSCYQSYEDLIKFIGDFIPDLIIFDEAHYFYNQIEWSLKYFKCHKLYLSATPYENNFGIKILEFIKIRDLIQQEFLSRVKTVVKRTTKNNLSGFISSSFIKYKRCCGLVFSSTQEKAIQLMEHTNIDGVKKFICVTRIDELTAFEQCEEPKIIFTCRKINYGYDNPNIDAIYFGNSTESIINITQSIGRGLRPKIIDGIAKILHIFIPVNIGENEGEYKWIFKILDFIIGNCYIEPEIFHEDINKFEHQLKYGFTPELNDNDLIDSEIWNKYCSHSLMNMDGFIRYLKWKEIKTWDDYLKLIEKDKELPLDPKSKYTKFKWKMIFEKSQYLEKKELIKKYGDMSNPRIQKKLHDLNNKIPCFNLDDFY